MERILLKFRQIYQQFTEAKSVLSAEGIALFDKNFNFDIYVILEKEFKEDMSIEEHFNTFEILWVHKKKVGSGMQWVPKPINFS